MKNQFNLNIKTPCSENFSQFSQTPNGGFCSSCEKEVIDFTKMNANEIITYFNTKTNKNTCGKFNSHQLKTYRQPQQRKRLNILSGIGLACLSLFSINTSQAQDIKNQAKTTGENSEIKASAFENNITVKGLILDEDGLALPGANILLEGTAIATQTNFDGEFEFPKKLKKGDIIVISFVGYQSKKITIENEKSVSEIELKIDMTMDSCILMGKVAVKEVYKSKRKK
ncbi:carboxypeptidase-like regulatory domain-containing protein [uncultured Lacinutrix sp.]|uniref:carboxypeptidase-like regulatory domain-containing protein n=1 Tax=uncultured Lacinutrix sp. TaxID=574032 RepID=UPI002605903D|nr:carboxypeptidase-like regulatory domain-containing protein [uncultured Lacinutrix sp.]